MGCKRRRRQKPKKEKKLKMQYEAGSLLAKPFVDDILYMLKEGKITLRAIQNAWGELLEDWEPEE